MNTQNILLLADYITQHTELLFDMAQSSMPQPHKCNTAGCIGGFGAALWPQAACHYTSCFDGERRSTFKRPELIDLLGITDDEASQLFYPNDNNVPFVETEETFSYDDITRQGAIQTLRRLAETGQIIWRQDEQLPDASPAAS